MLWFFESFFPVVWIAFLLYWQIKGRRYQNHPAPGAGRLAHPAGPRLPDRDRPPLDNSYPAALALPPALAVWHQALLGLELLLPSSAFSSPSGRASTSAATGAAP